MTVERAGPLNDRSALKTGCIHETITITYIIQEALSQFLIGALDFWSLVAATAAKKTIERLLIFLDSFFTLHVNRMGHPFILLHWARSGTFATCFDNQSYI